MLVFTSITDAQTFGNGGNGKFVIEKKITVVERTEGSLFHGTGERSATETHTIVQTPKADGSASAGEKNLMKAMASNLTPHTPSGWSSSIVISNTTNASLASAIDAGTIYNTDNVYVSFAALNNGVDPTPTGVTMYCYIYVDDVLKFEGTYSSALPASNFIYWINRSIGTFAAGTRTFRMVIDPTNVVPESNESDNTFQRTKTISTTTSVFISSFSPTSGPAGTSVTITGSNFGATQGTGAVRFGSTNATVTSWTNTQITATVPSITAGDYTISVIATAGTGQSSTQFTVTTTATFPDPIPPMYKTTVSTAITSSYINAIVERNGEFWMVGDNGLIAKASSMVAGFPVTWTLANGGIPLSEDIYAIDFADPMQGYVGTGTGKIYRTTNGGSSWTLVYDRPDITNFINFIKFDNLGTGMAMGDGLNSTSAMAFLATTDGGTTWNNRNTGLVGATSISEVYFVTANTGFLSGYTTIGGKSYRGIFRTTNGGTNWSFSTVGNTSIDSVTFTEALTFRTTSAGMAIRSDSTVWKTGNGGSTWTKVGQLPLMGFGVVYTSANSAFIAGRNGLIASINTANNIIYSVQLDPTLILSSPSYTQSFSAVILPVFNQARAYFSSINATTPLSTPSQLSPSNGAQISDTKATLAWSTVSGATVYDIEFGASISSVMRGKMSTSSMTSTVISDLSASTLYRWRVRARSTTNSSAWSQMYSFTTAALQPVSNVISASFPSAPKSSSDYRLVSVPNATSTTVGDYIKGSPPNDFRIYRDNGGSPPNHLTEMNGSSSVTIGEGYWLLKKNNFVINTSLNFPSPSTTTGAVSITTRIGWNIIGTPYAVPVQWSDIRSANSLSANAVAYSYNGTSGFKPADILEPFRGYYYFSNTGSLSIPFPFAITPSLTVQEPALQLDLVHSSSQNSDGYLKIGIDPAAQNGQDEFETRKPPVFSDQAAIWIEKPEWDAEQPRFAGDIRPSLGDGQTWEIVLQHPDNEPSRLSIENGDRIPAGYDIVFIDKSTGVMHTPDAQRGMAIPVRKGTSTYSVIIGKQSYIRSQTESFIPKQYVLHQNYPNPFNPATAIRFGLVDDAFVQMKVYDLLGREVAVIVNEALMSGNHEYTVNAKALSTGTYFYSLRASSLTDGKILFTSLKKMLLIK
jgi:photosystem II stability/assembly factor-like uncharacterized protein